MAFFVKKSAIFIRNIYQINIFVVLVNIYIAVGASAKINTDLCGIYVDTFVVPINVDVVANLEPSNRQIAPYSPCRTVCWLVGQCHH